MPPPAKNFLTQEQVSKLQEALKESNLPHIRERILIILLQNDGKPQHEIAKFLGCSHRTVAYWCMHGDPDNLETLHNKREYEHWRKATPEYIELLLKTVAQEPEMLNADTKLYIISYTKSQKLKLVSKTSSPQTNEHS